MSKLRFFIPLALGFFVVAVFAQTPALSSTSDTNSVSILGIEFAITNPPTPPAIPEKKAELAKPLETSQEPEETADNGSAVDTDEDTPVVLESMEIKKDELGSRPWQPPNYASQTGVLGYGPDTFKVPAGLEPQVNFWIDMFTKYTTDQGVLHDSRYINLIYAEVDFKKIEGYNKMSAGQQRRAREKLVKGQKKEIVDRLKRLATLKSAEGLTGEDLRVWKLFENIDEGHKFTEAAQKGRLRFQLGQKDRFVQGIYYSGRYLAKMEQIFRDEGMPIELTRIPFVESSFNLKARSKVGASGIWQFMRHTGRIYMKLNSLVDDRNDPLVATRGAARLLKFNYNLLQAWPLAVTAYNFGPSGMKREKDKLKTDNLVEIARRSTARRFGFASSNFFASFLAVLEVERNADKYFGKPEWSNALEFEDVVLPKPVRFGVVLDQFGGDVDRAFLYNPHFTGMVRRGRVALPTGTRVRLPKSGGERFLASLTTQPSRPEPQIKTGVTQYRVAQGDTLSSIAREFGIAITVLQEANGIDNPRSLRVGQTLEIPGSGQ